MPIKKYSRRRRVGRNGIVEKMIQAQQEQARSERSGLGRAVPEADVLLCRNHGLCQISGAADWPRILRHYQADAQKGNADAQYKLGILYEWGIGTDADNAQAMAWYGLAAQQGDEDAQFALEHCRIVERALQGDSLAQYQYAQRLEAIADPAAFDYYLRSAGQGNADAQYRAGLYCAFGKVTESDVQAAVRWFRQAAQQGHTKAGFLLDWMLHPLRLGGEAQDPEEAFTAMQDRLSKLSGEEQALVDELYSDGFLQTLPFDVQL